MEMPFTFAAYLPTVDVGLGSLTHLRRRRRSHQTPTTIVQILERFL